MWVPGRHAILIPSVEIGRSDSQEGTSGSSLLRHFSFNFKEKKIAIMDTTDIKLKE